MNEKDHPRYTKEQLREAFYVIGSLADEIVNGNITADEIEKSGFINKKEADSAIEGIGHLLELYGA